MKTRIGIIGTGFIAGQHLQALTQIDGVSLDAIAGENLDQARSFCEEKAPNATAYASAMELVEQADLDAVYFCIPPFAHQGEVERAAERGLHVFLEKPIALNSERARSMVEAIETAGVVSQVGFHMRFRKSVRELKSRIDSGQAGKPTLFTGRYWVNMDGSAWWRDPKCSGGQILEQVIHIYDLALHLCGDVEQATGLLRNLCHPDRPDYQIEDTSLGSLHFKNGALGIISGSNCAIPMHFIADFRLVCEKLTFDYACGGQPWVTPDQGTLYAGVTSPESIIEDGNPTLEESLDFLNAIHTGKPTLTPARHGLEAIELVEAVMGGKNGGME